MNGKKSGKGERRCTHTQLDPQAWWEVDLGQLCVIERIIVWNRTDAPEDETRPRDEYTALLFPFWVFISQTEFSDLVGGKSFALAHRQSCELKKFTKNRRKSTWNVPANTVGRFVRIQLEKQNYLHIAEVEVFGRTGTRLGVSQVSSVKCGNCTTIAVVKPRVDKNELEAAYKTAVRADADAAFVRGVRAWSSRTLLFHVSVMSLKLQEHHSNRSLIPCKKITRKSTLGCILCYDEYITRASRSNTGTQAVSDLF